MCVGARRAHRRAESTNCTACSAALAPPPPPAPPPCSQVKAESVLDEASLRQLYFLLEEFAMADGDALKINYDGFSQVPGPGGEDQGWRQGWGPGRPACAWVQCRQATHRLHAWVVDVGWA